jgi:tyrosyl-tRNA synthetase
MESDVELGGSEQLFNLLIGRDYQEYFGQPKQICMTTPILVGTDGVVRMGKSRGNYVGLTEPPEEQFGKLMSLPDEATPEFARLAAFWSREQLEKLREGLRDGSRHPMDAKKEVAEAIVARYHGAAAARAARDRFERTVQRGELPQEMPTIDASPEWRTIADALLAARFSASRREAERLIAGGGVKLDGIPVTDTRQSWKAAAKPTVLSVGTRRFVRIVPALRTGGG